jgi:hypothetical protein
MPVLITQQRSLRCQVLLGRYLLYRFVEILPLQHTVALSQRFLIETLLMMTILFCKIIYAQHTNPIIFKPCLSRLLYWLLLPANGVDTQPLQLAQSCHIHHTSQLFNHPRLCLLGLCQWSDEDTLARLLHPGGKVHGLSINRDSIARYFLPLE